MSPRTRKYKGHTITSCGLSWYIDRTPGKADGIFAETLEAAKAKVGMLNVDAGITLRKDENVRQDEVSGAWYAEVANYPGCEPHWVKIGGAHDSKAAALFTIQCSRIP